MSVTPNGQESLATDEGFHDESANDTDPLVSSNCSNLGNIFQVEKRVRKVQFKNTVLEIGTRHSSGSSGSSGLIGKR